MQQKEPKRENRKIEKEIQEEKGVRMVNVENTMDQRKTREQINERNRTKQKD